VQIQGQPFANINAIGSCRYCSVKSLVISSCCNYGP